MAKQSEGEKLFAADLARSGLTLKDAVDNGFELWAPEKTAKAFPFAGKVWAYKIPYLQPKGATCYRVRVLQPPPGPFGTVKKDFTRYWQPAKTAPAPYYCNTFGWPAFLGNKENKGRLLFVEGEKKAIKATNEGFPTIGLGGVFSFKSKHLGLALLPEFAKIEFSQRPVYIVFDSDATTNPMVALAIKQFSEVLIDRGAQVFVATMPTLPGMDKVGLDDFLLARGPAALDRHLRSAPSGDLARLLWEFNEKFAVVKAPSCVLDETSSDVYGRPVARVLSKDAFAGLNYANIKTLETYETASGEERTRDVKVAEKWIEYGSRRQYDGMTYLPGGPSVLPNNYYNVWPKLGIEPKKGDVKPWHALLDVLFQGAPKHVRQWFERWCGYPLKHPGTKLQSAVGLWSSVTGVGKSLAAQTLGYIYGSNYIAISQADLESSFNQWAINKQFVLVDEVSASDTRARADLFKKLLTQTEIWVNPKGVQQYALPDYVNYFLTSNHANAFFVEDNDRRYFIHRVTADPLPKPFYNHFVFDWIGLHKPNGVPAIGAPKGPGCPALLHYFLHELDYGAFDPFAAPPMTEAKCAMMEGVRSPVDAWLHEVMTELPNFSKRDLYTVSELTTAYNAAGNGRNPIAPNTMGMHVDKIFPVSVYVMRDGRRCKFRAIRNGSKWATAKAEERETHVAVDKF